MLHLTYCTNVHRGETWPETFESLNQYTLAVRERVCPDRPYGIGLRLSEEASRQLAEPSTLTEFRTWLDRHNCYVFTINGFPYGRFHGAGVRERVYLPDWTSPERVAYTNRLFDLLATLLPSGIEGSVSTVPGMFKAFYRDADQLHRIYENLAECAHHIADLCEKHNRTMHLGLEPEPLCLMETTVEAVQFFDRMRTDHPKGLQIRELVGVTYDTCHQAVEFENPLEAITRLRRNGIKISKIQLSSALKVRPTEDARRALCAFTNSTYLHQVVARDQQGALTRFSDLAEVLSASPRVEADEWRIHFHVPLHSTPADTAFMGNTNDHLLGILDALKADPALCSHLEMETYTWEVMPAELKNRSVVDQLTLEFEWCKSELSKRTLMPV